MVGDLQSIPVSGVRDRRTDTAVFQLAGDKHVIWSASKFTVWSWPKRSRSLRIERLRQFGREACRLHSKLQGLELCRAVQLLSELVAADVKVAYHHGIGGAARAFFRKPWTISTSNIPQHSPGRSFISWPDSSWYSFFATRVAFCV